MIFISDDEDEIQEMKTRTQLKKRPKENVTTISPTNMQNEKGADSEDEVHVIEEISHVSKKPNVAVIGSFHSHEESGINLCNIRKRVRPDLNTIKCSMKRTSSPGTLRYMNNCMNMKRRLFCIGREQSVRLEEKMKYFKLLQSIIGEALCSTLIRQAVLPSILPSSNSTPQRQQRNVPETHKATDVQVVDLTSDSDIDLLEVENASSISESEIEETSKDYNHQDCDFVELADETGASGSSKMHEFEINQTRSPLSVDTSNDSDENQDQCIDLVEDSEDEFKLNTSKNSSSYEIKDPRGKLEAQMLQQMNIVDHKPEVIDVSGDEQKGISGVSCEIDDDDDSREEMPKLTEEMEVLVYSAFKSKSDEVFVEGFNLVIRDKDIHTLKGYNWLNDEVINFYMCLLMERGKLSNYPSVYCFNTFFYVKLAESGHSSLKRWTRKVDIFSYDLIIVPVHLKVHWCLACINFPEKQIEYYDSMGGQNKKCCSVLMDYLKDEHLDKKKKAFNSSQWKIVYMKDIPEQLNGSDCGVFLCTYAEYICRLSKFTFTQRDMPYFRVKIAYEILTKKLLL